MDNVPKSVLQRLQAQAAEAHPDANLLAAFAEQVLPESERAGVIRHLAHCGDCREVVALALPASEGAGTTAMKGLGRRWLSLPVLRWGVVAAGVVVLTSIGVLEYKLAKPRESRLAALPTEGQSASPIAKSIASAAVPEAQPQAPREQTELIMDNKVARQAFALADSERALPRARKRMAADALAGARPGIAAAAGASESAPFATTAPAFNSAAPAPGKAAPSAAPLVPRASEVVEVQAQAGPGKTGPANTETAQTANQIAEKQNILPMNGRNVMKLDVVKAKDPVAAKSAPAVAAATPRDLQTQSTLKAGAGPHWSISASGSLQRSFDAGKTWEEVSVTGPLGSAAAMVVSVEGNGGYKKEEEADQDKDKVEAKRLAKAPANPLFRAVSASGPEVWAGGVGALLYHSTDMGAHWTRVIPATASAVATGDITGIQFADPQHGRVATTTGEVWMTSDSGQSWRKQ
jgi:hypothetical protein